MTGSTGLTNDLSANARSTQFTGLTPSASYTFTVRALNAEGATGAGASATATGTRFTGLTVARTGTSATKVSGRLLNTASTGLGGKIVQVQRRAANGTWSTVAKPKTDSSGHLAVTREWSQHGALPPASSSGGTGAHRRDVGLQAPVAG